MVHRLSQFKPFYLRGVALALAVSTSALALCWLGIRAGLLNSSPSIHLATDVIVSTHLHGFFESLCVTAGVLTLGIALAVNKAYQTPRQLILACGFFWCGLIHAFPAVTPVEAIAVVVGSLEVPVTGAAARLLCTILVTFSAALSMGWSFKKQVTRVGSSLTLVSILGALSVLGVVVASSRTFSPGTAAMLEKLNLFLLCTVSAGVWVTLVVKDFNRFNFAFFLGWAPLLVSQIAMVFFSRVAFDPYFFLADALTVSAYFLRFFGILVESLQLTLTSHQENSRRHEATLKTLQDNAAALEQEIRENQTMETVLTETAERFNQLVNNLNQAFWISDAYRVEIIYVSPGYEKIWERPCKELQENPRTFLQAIHPDDFDRVLFAQSKLTIGLYDEEYRIVLPDGNTRWVRDRGFPVEHPSGVVERVVGIVEDITYQKEAEQIISEQRLQMLSSSKMSSLGEMAGGIAHEINNPLAVIHTRAGQLKELAELDQITPELVRMTAEKIEQTVMRISKIVRGLRSFARDGDADPYQATSIRAIVYDTFEFCREKFKHHLVEASINEISEDLLVECRATQISQLLLNLVSNAYDAIEKEPQKWIRVEVIDQGEWIKIQITDSGKGIPAQVAERIFQPFYTTKEIGKGTGLGLSICKGIVDAHQGELSLDSACENTRFIIQLPKHQGRLVATGQVAA